MPGRRDATSGTTPLRMRTVRLPDGTEVAIACVPGCCDDLSDQQLVEMIETQSPDDSDD
ncbi:hypothetical protein [Streptomyces sp. KR80]|uniref:hypothetical protein n=1 Tax=Streptomyces sp. KR80 TaxID=3457426 RepID=UPI003FD50005